MERTPSIFLLNTNIFLCQLKFVQVQVSLNANIFVSSASALSLSLEVLRS